jgi:AMMECR1 domain-containing protein
MELWPLPVILSVAWGVRTAQLRGCRGQVGDLQLSPIRIRTYHAKHSSITASMPNSCKQEYTKEALKDSKFKLSPICHP